ncbi:MAG: hypothetical protein KC496_18785, partial [Anaerolineae bacterium]|nr:hypothetical protein [Anaerolineae bacterium]
KMAWVHSHTLRQPLRALYDSQMQQEFIHRYYRQQHPSRWQQRLTALQKRGRGWLRRLKNTLR